MTKALIPLFNATTESYFVSAPLLAPSEVEFDSADIFDRGMYQTSDLSVGVSLPLEMLCKLPCSHWTSQDGIDFQTLALKHITFLAENTVTGERQVLTTGDLFGISGGKTVPPVDSPFKKSMIDFRIRHFSTRLLKAVTAEPVTVFGTDEGQHAHFSLQVEYNAHTDILKSVGLVEKCSNPDVKLNIIGFALHAEHERVSLAA